MKLADVIHHIERTAPLSIAASWDRSGVQVASGREEIRRLAVCLDPTPASVSRALDEGADMILSHHPLTLEPRFTDRLDAYREVLFLLFRADVPLYAAHTSLDANPVGPVGWLAEELVLRRPEGVSGPLEVLEKPGEMECEGRRWDCGFGVIGNRAPLSPDDLRNTLAPWLEGSCPRLVGKLPEQLERIAICPGSGGSLAEEAFALGANLLITGDLKYHPALEMPLPVLDVGHFSLEEEMMRRFSLCLKDSLPGVDVKFLEAQDPLRPFFATHRPWSAGAPDFQE